MSPSSDMDSASRAVSRALEADDSRSLPPTWYEALLALVASRVSIIQLESKEAARYTAKLAIVILTVAACVFFAWLLLLAGSVQLLAASMQWPWGWVAIGIALIHILGALLVVKYAKPSPISAFPFTRAEFQKDREWIEQFKKNKKSNG